MMIAALQFLVSTTRRRFRLHRYRPGRILYCSTPVVYACNYDSASCDDDDDDDDDDDVIVDLLPYCSRVGLALERTRRAALIRAMQTISRRRPRYVKIVGVARVSAAAVRARDIRRLCGTVGISSACRDIIATIIFIINNYE